MARIKRTDVGPEFPGEDKPPAKLPGQKYVTGVSGTLTYRSDSSDTFRSSEYRWYFVGSAGVAFARVEGPEAFTLYLNGHGGAALIFRSEKDMHQHLIDAIQG